MVAHPAGVRAVLSAEPALWNSGEANLPLRPVIGTRNVLLLDGPEHLRRRKLVLPPFHGERLKRYREVMAEVAREQVGRWPRGESFPLLPRLQEITFEVILRVVFGGGEAQRLRAALRALLDWLVGWRGLLAFNYARPRAPAPAARLPPHARRGRRGGRRAARAPARGPGRGHAVDAAADGGAERPRRPRRAADAARRRPRDDRRGAGLGVRGAAAPARGARSASPRASPAGPRPSPTRRCGCARRSRSSCGSSTRRSPSTGTSCPPGRRSRRRRSSCTAAPTCTRSPTRSAPSAGSTPSPARTSGSRSAAASGAASARASR